MTTESDEIIDRIVAGVLKQLQAPSDGVVRASEAPVSAASNGAASKTTVTNTVEIRDGVITGSLLEERGVISGPLVFGTKSVLTPSALDFLATRKLQWRRADATNGVAAERGRWLVLVTRSTPAVAAALEAVANGKTGASGKPGSGTGPGGAAEWKHELSGCHREAAGRAVSALCRGECDGVLIFTGKPEAAVCRANRNSRVRGAALATVTRIKPLQIELGANLLAVNPADRSAFELRNLLREVASIGKPAAPADWKE